MNEKKYIDTNKSLSFATIAAMSSFSAIMPTAVSNIEGSTKLVYEQVQEQNYLYNLISANQQQDLTYFKKLISFAEKFIESQRDLDEESQKILNENFWDLV